MGAYRIPTPANEPIRAYPPGSPERAHLQARLKELAGERIEIPLVIGGRPHRTGRLATAVMPHQKSHVLADVHQAGAEEVQLAVEAAAEAWADWSRLPWWDRAAVFLRAADLLAGPWRDTLNAATMLGQSKTAHQAEIDSACELIDFWRFNAAYQQRIYEDQPDSSPGVWNRMEYRPLEGFVFAVTPFNFTSIAGNLPTSAALMGNTVVWKPASTAAFSAHFILRLLEAAGLPPGVINLVYGRGSEVGEPVLAHRDLAGVHFTGSTAVFQGLWKAIAEHLPDYRNYPRIVGETGGKNFVLAHPSAEVDALVVAVVRGGFEYQGQKCSACSRFYVPQSLWPKVRERLAEEVRTIAVGDVADFRNFMGAVIDGSSYETQRKAIEEARAKPEYELLVGGELQDGEGWFVRPTVVVTRDPRARLMREELFGPVVTTFVYPDREWSQVLELVDTTTPYGLTGAVFATERAAIVEAESALRHAAGNFYVNDKPTGAVVGQQPFGGARASGTNDKAGSVWNLTRWVSPRAIKETLNPPRDWRYPFLAED